MCHFNINLDFQNCNLYMQQESFANKYNQKISYLHKSEDHMISAVLKCVFLLIWRHCMIWKVVAALSWQL